jgi:two-component system sensor histidine kinase ChvG
MAILLKSRTFQGSGIGGETRRTIPRELRRKARRLSASLTLKLVALVCIFAALPIVLYGQFESADHQTRELVVGSLKNRSWLVAQALRPQLDRPEGPSSASLNQELAKYAGDGTDLKLMFQPAQGQARKGFYYVAAAPRVEPEHLGAELDSLAQHGILQRLSESCSWDSPTEIRYTQPSGAEEILTAVIPIQSRWGCWVLVSSHSTTEYLQSSIGRPFWQTQEVRVAAAIYLVVAILGAVIAWSVWRSIRHFRRVAQQIRGGCIAPQSFAARTVVPELAVVAADLDRLLRDLHSIAQDIRQTSEDNAHSFKSPLATIQSSLEPLRKLIPANDERARRAISLIDSSLGRLRTLAVAAQRLDHSMADLIEAPPTRVNFTQIVAEALLRHREVLAGNGVQVVRRLDDNLMVEARKGMLDVAVENILDNAIGFSPRGGTVAVTLSRARENIELVIEDEGPGIDSSRIDCIFDRYFSHRPRQPGELAASPGEPGHAGLGLWIVKRNVEALGGRVIASNRIGGGLAVRVILPIGEAV